MSKLSLQDTVTTSEYTLSFHEALQAIFENDSWAQGEEYADGVILMAKGGLFIRGRDELHLHDFKAKLSKDEKFALSISKNAINQKYRLVSTQFDAERKKLGIAK